MQQQAEVFLWLVKSQTIKKNEAKNGKTSNLRQELKSNAYLNITKKY